MKRSILPIVMIVAALLSLEAEVFAQHRDHQGTEQQPNHTQKQVKEVYTCPMHPDVKSDKPGKCPKCGMSLVLVEQKGEAAPQSSDQELSGKEKALKAKKLLEEAKEDLVYSCCLEDSCDRCALDHQSCQCNKDLRAGKGVCSDCYAGWQMGQGKIKGIKANDVKPNFHSYMH